MSLNPHVLKTELERGFLVTAFVYVMIYLGVGVFFFFPFLFIEILYLRC